MRVICVTDRKLCGDGFLSQLGKICAGGISRIILREKDLDEADYSSLAAEAMEICRNYSTPISLHTYINAAAELHAEGIHLTCQSFVENRRNLSDFTSVGVSVHSASEAQMCERLGASYVTAGHIFPTDCKKGVPPRGLDYLEEICGGVNIPVYAIGGISPENVRYTVSAGASGVCMMSSLMKSKEPAELIKLMKNKF